MFPVATSNQVEHTIHPLQYCSVKLSAVLSSVTGIPIPPKLLVLFDTGCIECVCQGKLKALGEYPYPS